MEDAQEPAHVRGGADDVDLHITTADRNVTLTHEADEAAYIGAVFLGFRFYIAAIAASHIHIGDIRIGILPERAAHIGIAVYLDQAGHVDISVF